MLKLDGLMICSENTGQLVEFYKKIFTKDPDWTGGEYVGWKLGESYLVIGPHSEVKGKNSDSPRIMFQLTSDNVQDEYKRMVDAGAKSIQEPYHPEEASEMWQATLEDPDGNYFQVGSPME